MNEVINSRLQKTEDHIIPVARGGSNKKDNIQIICSKCNTDKDNLTHDEYIVYLKSSLDRYSFKWSLPHYQKVYLSRNFKLPEIICL